MICTHRWEVIHWNVTSLLGTILLKKTYSSSPRHHQLFLSCDWRLRNPFPLQAGMLTGLVLSRDPVGNHGIYQFMNAVSCPDDTVWLQSSMACGSSIPSVPSTMVPESLVGYAICVPFVGGYSTGTSSTHSGQLWVSVLTTVCCTKKLL